MFFSPPSFPHALNQKKDDCVQKAREGMGNPGKAWEIPGTAKSPGLQNPRDGKILGTAKSPRITKSPGQQNPGKSRARSASTYIK